MTVGPPRRAGRGAPGVRRWAEPRRERARAQRCSCAAQPALALGAADVGLGHLAAAGDAVAGDDEGQWVGAEGEPAVVRAGVAAQRLVGAVGARADRLDGLERRDADVVEALPVDDARRRGGRAGEVGLDERLRVGEMCAGGLPPRRRRPALAGPGRRRGPRTPRGSGHRRVAASSTSPIGLVEDAAGHGRAGARWRSPLVQGAACPGFEARVVPHALGADPFDDGRACARRGTRAPPCGRCAQRAGRCRRGAGRAGSGSARGRWRWSRSAPARRLPTAASMPSSVSSASAA